MLRRDKSDMRFTRNYFSNFRESLLSYITFHVVVVALRKFCDILLDEEASY